jgi:hypothetical protein
MPGTFAIVDKGHIVLLLIQWDKFYVEPDFKNIVVSYKLSQNGVETRLGKINIDILQKNKAMGFFQSWKGATREFLGRYNEYLMEMSRTIVNKLVAEL